MNISLKKDLIWFSHKKALVASLSLMMCSWSAFATQYVVPGGAGDYTGGSWANAQSNVQAAVDAAELPGEEVWVAAGRYEITEPVTLRSGSVLLGGFSGVEANAEARDWDANVTVLDGLDATQVVSMVSLSSVRFDGLVVTRGRIATSGKVGGGGILIEGSEACEIANCKILHNEAKSTGGAVEAGGIFINFATNCVIDNCLFTDNKSAPYGTSITALSSSGLTVKACRFVGCYYEYAAGVVRLQLNADVNFINCLISGNKAGQGYGTFVYVLQAINVINCTICFTYNGLNGTLYLGSNNNLMRNNLMAFNHSVAVYERSAIAPPLENNLFYGQSAGDYFDFNTTNHLTGADELNTNAVPDKASGNVDGDPRFVRCPTQDDGTWTAVEAYNQDRTQTTLTDTSAAFRPGALKGRFLNPDTTELYRHAEIADNTATSITVWGKANWTSAGKGYRIYDYRLQSDSAAINAGLATGAPSVDLDDNPRPALGGIDIGAYEAQPVLGTIIIVL